LFRADVALNISHTAVNSVIAVFTLPLITTLAIMRFMPGDPELGVQFAHARVVFAIVPLPLLPGTLGRWRMPAFATRTDTPVRIASTVTLAVVIGGACVSNWQLLTANVGSLALITIAFCVLSLAVGFFVPRLFRVEPRQAVASSFEIGIHNATLSIVIAQTVLNNMEMSLPAAVYGVLMFFVALGWGFLIRRLVPQQQPTPAAAPTT